MEPETPIITYCDGETCNLSHDLALFLRDMGFMNVRVLVNGWTAWHESRFPVESSEFVNPTEHVSPDNNEETAR